MADGDPPIPPPSNPCHDLDMKPYLSEFLNLKNYSVNGKVSQVLCSDENPTSFKSSASKSTLPQNIVSKSNSSSSKIFGQGLSFGQITFQDLVSSELASPVGASSSGAVSLSSKTFNLSSVQAPLSSSSPSDSTSVLKLLSHAINSNTPYSTVEITQTSSASKSVHKHLSTATTTNTTASFIEVVKYPNDPKTVQGFEMLDCKKDVSFCPSNDSVTTLWIRMEGIPSYMFEEAPLLAIANAIGTPVCVDPLFIKRVKLNSARVCVELNVAGPLFDYVWVAFEDDDSKNNLKGFWVEVCYEVVPPFCSFCSHTGLALQTCFRRSGKQGDVNKVLGISAQPENSTVQKVVDIMPQPAEFSKVLRPLGNPCSKDVGDVAQQQRYAITASRDIETAEQQRSTSLNALKYGTESSKVADLQQRSDLFKGAMMHKLSPAQVSLCATDVDQDETGDDKWGPEQKTTTVGVVHHSNTACKEVIANAESNTQPSISTRKNSVKGKEVCFSEDKVFESIPQQEICTSNQSNTAASFQPGTSSDVQPDSERFSIEGSAVSREILEGTSAVINSRSAAGSSNAAVAAAKEWVCSTAVEKVDQLPAIVTIPRKDWVCSTAGFKLAVQQFIKKEWFLEKAGFIPMVQQIVDIWQPKCVLVSNLPQIAKPENDQTSQDATDKQEYKEGANSGSYLQPAVNDSKKGMNQKKPEVCMQTTVAPDKQRSSIDSSNQTTEKRAKIHGFQQKLCYDQSSKCRRARKWIQIAPISAGPGIIKSAPFQPQDKDRYTEMRGQGHPFDDKG